MEGLSEHLTAGQPHATGVEVCCEPFIASCHGTRPLANHLVVLLTESTAGWCFQRFPKFLFQPYTCEKKVQILDPIKKWDAVMGSGVPNDWPSLGSAWLPRWGVMCRFLGLSLAKNRRSFRDIYMRYTTLWWIDKYIHMGSTWVHTNVSRQGWEYCTKRQHREWTKDTLHNL